MARKIHRKYALRRKKARRNQRNRALWWVREGLSYGDSRHIPYVRVNRWMHTNVLHERDGGLALEPTRRRYSALISDKTFFNRLTREEYWAFQEEHDAETRRYYERAVHLSQQTHGRGGKRWYKQKYHRLRRQQARMLCHHALYEDEKRFESIPNCDYFRGAIAWDIY